MMFLHLLNLDIKVTGAHRTDRIVDDNGFGVQEAIFIDENFGAILNQFADIGQGDPVDKDMIRFVGDHNSDIDAR